MFYSLHRAARSLFRRPSPGGGKPRHVVAVVLKELLARVRLPVSVEPPLKRDRLDADVTPQSLKGAWECVTEQVSECSTSSAASSGSAPAARAASAIAQFTRLAEPESPSSAASMSAEYSLAHEIIVAIAAGVATETVFFFFFFFFFGVVVEVV